MKLLVFITLLLHVNFAMFIPQVDEVDIYDKSGNQLLDVNSLSEFIFVTLHPQAAKQPAKDKDDDNARYFHVSKLGHFFSQPFLVLLKSKPINSAEAYAQFVPSRYGPVYFEIQSPPPEA